MAPHSPLVLSLIGRAELRDAEGTLVPLPTRKVVLLLAMLAFEPGRAFRRRELALAVWEGADEDDARKSLRNALAGLRKALPPDAILSDLDTVSLRRGLVAVPLDREAEGEFMPGFDNEWAIEHRLRIRAVRVREAIAASRDADDPAGALAYAERACRLDPLDAEAAELRTRLLRAQGRRSEAGAVETSFRVRAVRELGALPATVPIPRPHEEHPLVVAAEWLLDRNPDEACALLASTQTQWMGTAVDRALDLHQRTLAASVRPSPARRSVVAAAHLLRTMSGEGSGHSKEVVGLFREALENGEGVVAFRLAETLAYANLSRGEFDRANRFAGEALDIARRFGDMDLRIGAGMTAGIIDLHTGAFDSSRRRLERSYFLGEESGASRGIASHRINYASSLLEARKFDRVVPMIDATRRELSSPGGERHRPWLAMLEADLHEGLEDHASALAILEGARETASNAGQAAVAMTDDALVRVYCHLGEFDRAAEAFVRVTAFRHRLGIVPSVYERAKMAPSVQTLRERLSREDRRAAMARVVGTT